MIPPHAADDDALALQADPRPRLLCLVNPKSRSGSDGVAQALGALEQHGFKLVTGVLPDLDDAGAWAERRAEGAAGLVVAGGDGTLNAVAPIALRTGLPLGILPTGTANDLARTLDIPTDPTAAARIIEAGHRRRIDLGDVNGHPFFNVASIGLSVALARKLDRGTKRRFGRLSYAIATAMVLREARRFRATIISDRGTVEVSSLQIAIGNGCFYGGGLSVRENARIDDRSLALYSLEFANAWKLLAVARDFVTGRHGSWQEVRALSGPAFEIRTETPMAVNADGEIITSTPACFTVRPAAIEVFAPLASPGSGPA